MLEKNAADNLRTGKGKCMSSKINLISILCFIAGSLFVACGEAESPEESCREMIEYFFNELDDGNWVNAQNYLVSGDLPELWKQEGLKLESVSIETIADGEAVATISVKFFNEVIQNQYTCVQMGNSWKIEI